MSGLSGLPSTSSLNLYDIHSTSALLAKRNNIKGREPKLFQFYGNNSYMVETYTEMSSFYNSIFNLGREDKFQFPASEFEIKLASSSNSKVWLYFGTLYHHGQPACDRLYCSPCFENQKIEGLNYYLSALMSRIKHYAKSVSTGMYRE